MEKFFFSTSDVFSLFNCYRPQRSCGKVIFYTPVCQSFRSQGGSDRPPPPRQPPALGRQHPGRHTPSQTPPPPGRHPCLRADNPQADKPPGRHYAPRQTATAADGTHPTGMHSCWSWNSVERSGGVIELMQCINCPIFYTFLKKFKLFNFWPLRLLAALFRSAKAFSFSSIDFIRSIGTTTHLGSP